MKLFQIGPQMHTSTWANFSENVTFGKLYDIVPHHLDYMQQVHGHCRILHVKDGGFAKCCVGPKNASGSLGRVS